MAGVRSKVFKFDPCDRYYCSCQHLTHQTEQFLCIYLVRLLGQNKNFCSLMPPPSPPPPPPKKKKKKKKKSMAYKFSDKKKITTCIHNCICLIMTHFIRTIHAHQTLVSFLLSLQTFGIYPKAQAKHDGQEFEL